jgi:hypothetical protein
MKKPRHEDEINDFLAEIKKMRNPDDLDATLEDIRLYWRPDEDPGGVIRKACMARLRELAEARLA